MSLLQSRSCVLKDNDTNTLFVGMCPGDYAIVAGTYYFDVIKGVVEVYGILFGVVCILRSPLQNTSNSVFCRVTDI